MAAKGIPFNELYLDRIDHFEGIGYRGAVLPYIEVPEPLGPSTRLLWSTIRHSQLKQTLLNQHLKSAI